MSGLVNKVKEALSSSHDTPSDERTGKLNLTAEERERLEAAGYGSSNHADKRHLGATEDVTQTSAGHPPSYYLDQNTTETSAVPGAFPPSQSENIGSHHKDGREYVAPTGTHTGSSEAKEHKVHEHTSTHHAGHGTTSNVKDTPVSENRSRTAETAAVGGGAAAVAGAGVIAAEDHKHGSNKLHKKEDPRGHVAFNEPPTHDSIHGSQTSTNPAVVSSTTAVHHSIPGSHPQSSTVTGTGSGTGTGTSTADVYEQQAARKYDGNSDSTLGSTPNYSYPTATTAAAAGAGGLATSQIPERKQHEAHTTSGSQTIGSQGHSATTGIGHDSSAPRGVGVYNTVTGAGSPEDPTHGHSSYTIGSTGQDQTFQSHPGLKTGAEAVPRDAGSSTVTGGGYGSRNTASSNAPLPSTLTGATGQDHHGPGHVGSKVVHTCTKCGEDNDITHYFKKETVYRLSQ